MPTQTERTLNAIPAHPAVSIFRKSDFLILTAAFLSFLFSVSLWFGFGMTANKEAGIFVGLWVPSILGTGIYFQQIAQRIK